MNVLQEMPGNHTAAPRRRVRSCPVFLPAFSASVNSGMVQTVIVAKPDRLTRSVRGLCGLMHGPRKRFNFRDHLRYVNRFGTSDTRCSENRALHGPSLPAPRGPRRARGCWSEARFHHLRGSVRSAALHREPRGANRNRTRAPQASVHPPSPNGKWPVQSRSSRGS